MCRPRYFSQLRPTYGPYAGRKRSCGRAPSSSSAIRSRQFIVSAAPTSRAYQLSRKLIVSQNEGAILDITANFRSQKAIIDHVNSCFEDVLSKPAQPGYVALAATVPEGSYGIPSVTRVTIQLEDKVYADKLREAEAAKVAEICERLIGNVTITRADKSRSPLRPVTLRCCPRATPICGATSAHLNNAASPFPRRQVKR